MTIQYWEVMRRYRLETCIDGVDLVLFVPMSLIPFLPEGQRFYLDNFAHTEFTREHFKTRYDTLLRYFATSTCSTIGFPTAIGRG